MYCVHIVFILLWCPVFQAPTLFSKPLSGWCEGPQDAVKDTGFPRFWDQDIFRAIRLIPLSDVQRDRSQYWETYPTWVPRKALRGRKKTRKEPRCDTWKASITSVKHDFLHLSTTFSLANSNTIQKVNELWGQSWFSHPDRSQALDEKSSAKPLCQATCSACKGLLETKSEVGSEAKAVNSSSHLRNVLGSTRWYHWAPNGVFFHCFTCVRNVQLWRSLTIVSP